MSGSIVEITSLTVDGLENVRDVGGVPTCDGGRCRPGVLLRSAAPVWMSPAGVETLVGELGVRTVIDVRSPKECERFPHLELLTSRARVLALPVDTSRRPREAENGERGAGEAADGEAERAGKLTDDDFRSPEVIGAAYADIARRCSDSLRRIAEVVADPAAGTTLVHCTAGKDRTGVTVAVLLAAAGVDEEQIATEYARSEHALDGVRAQLDRGGFYEFVSVPPRAFGAPAAAMRHCLRELAGGRPLEPALDELGIDAALRADLRARLVADGPAHG